MKLKFKYLQRNGPLDRLGKEWREKDKFWKELWELFMSSDEVIP